MTPGDCVFIGDEKEEDENEDELKLKIHHTWLALDEEDSYQCYIFYSTGHGDVVLRT